MDDMMKQHKEQTAREEAERAEFVATGRHPGAEPPSPAHKPEEKKTTFLEPDSKAAKRQRMAEALRRLNLNSPTESENSEESIMTSLSQDFSIFSLAKKMTESTNNDESGTVASSVWEPEREKEKNKTNKSDDANESGSYRKPTVEEATSG
jgi:hypothetical protein